MSCSMSEAWFQYRSGGFWVSSYLLKFPGVRSSPVFSSFGVQPSASGFWSFSYSSLKTSPSIQYEDKTPNLMMKQFSTARNTQRDSWSYIQRRRGRREIEVIGRRGGRVKRGKSNQASNQIPKCSPQPGTLREIHRVM